MCGLGQWGPNLLRNLRQNPDCEVVALCDPDRERRREFEELHPGAGFYASVQEIAGRDDVEAVVLATPAGLHPEHTRMMLEAGKDVLVEKPLAMDLETGRQLVRRAEELGRVLMTGHTFLFNPSVLKTKEIIDEGRLGRLHLVQAERMSLGRVRADCNALWNLAPHDISIFLHWFEEMPESVSARGAAFYGDGLQEDIAFCILEFPQKLMVSLQVSWMNPVKVRRMTLVGAERMLIYDDVDRERPLLLFDQRVEAVQKRDPEGSFEKFQLQVKKGPSQAVAVDSAEPLANEIACFIDCVKTRSAPRGSGNEALRVISVLEALDRSLKNGGRLIKPEPIG